MDAHIAELIGSDGANMYATSMPSTVNMPSASVNFGSVSDGTGWALMAAVVLLVIVYAKTRGIER